MNQFFKEFG